MQSLPMITVFAFQVDGRVLGVVRMMGPVPEINVVPSPTLINKRIKQPTDDADHQ